MDSDDDTFSDTSNSVYDTDDIESETNQDDEEDKETDDEVLSEDEHPPTIADAAVAELALHLDDDLDLHIDVSNDEYEGDDDGDNEDIKDKKVIKKKQLTDEKNLNPKFKCITRKRKHPTQHNLNNLCEGTVTSAFQRYLQQLPNRPTLLQQVLSPEKKVQQTIYSLLHARGLEARTCTSENLDDVRVLLGMKETLVVAAVFWIRERKVSIEDSRNIKIIMKKFNLTQIIVISQCGITPASKQFLQTLDINLQMFAESELSYKYIDHKLIPKQEVLNTTETKAFLTKYRITHDQLPRYLRTEAIVKFYGWPINSIVRITRIVGGGMKPLIYYRVVK